MRFLSDMSSWVLNTFQGWRFCYFSGQPIWPPLLLFFFSWYQIGAFHLPAYVRYISPCSAPPRKVWPHVLYALLLSRKRLRSPLRSPLRLSRPSFYVTCSSPKTSWWTYAGPTPVCQCPSCPAEPKSGHCTPNVVWTVPGRGRQSCPWTRWLCSF